MSYKIIKLHDYDKIPNNSTISGTFADQTHLYHLNVGLVRCSDFVCIKRIYNSGNNNKKLNSLVMDYFKWESEDIYVTEKSDNCH